MRVNHLVNADSSTHSREKRVATDGEENVHFTSLSLVCNRHDVYAPNLLIHYDLESRFHEEFMDKFSIPRNAARRRNIPAALLVRKIVASGVTLDVVQMRIVEYQKA